MIRGDLLVIPIEQSLLYVEPIYLRAEQGELPELRRVIVAYSDRVVMAETLDEGLATIFGDRPAGPEAVAPAMIPPPSSALSGEIRDRIQTALDAYEASQQALEQGDWEAYGQAQQRLEQSLQELQQKL